MADMYEKRSGKATRQKHEKDRRDKVVQVRMSDAGRAPAPISCAARCTEIVTRRRVARWFWTSRRWTVSELS